MTDARQALEDRKVVDQAKGLLIRALGIDEPTAFARLQRTARDRNLRVVDVAHSIIAQRALLEARRTSVATPPEPVAPGGLPPGRQAASGVAWTAPRCAANRSNACSEPATTWSMLRYW